MGFFAVRLHLPERSVHALLVQNSELTDGKLELERDIQELRAAIELLTIQVTYCQDVRVNTIAHARRGMLTMADCQEAIGNFTSPIKLQNEAIFGFGSSEKWSFAVYLYSAARDKLYPVWRAKAPGHPSEGPGRVWGRGEGHVGKAFVDQTAIVTGNASDREVADLSQLPPGRAKNYDASSYVSFASIPIGPILDHDTRPYGVLVGTSDRAGRFDRENTGIMVQIAGAIASLLIAADFDIDKAEGSPSKGSSLKEDSDDQASANASENGARGNSSTAQH